MLTADVGGRHSEERLLEEMRSPESKPRVVVVLNQPSIRVSATKLVER